MTHRSPYEVHWSGLSSSPTLHVCVHRLTLKNNYHEQQRRWGPRHYDLGAGLAGPAHPGLSPGASTPRRSSQADGICAVGMLAMCWEGFQGLGNHTRSGQTPGGTSRGPQRSPA